MFGLIKTPNTVFATNKVIEVNSVKDFLEIKNNPYGNYVLNSSLDFCLESSNFEPFEFYGTLDGNYHTLKNLNLVTMGEFAGLFSKINGAVIKNLTLDNFQIYGLDKGVGGMLAGEINNSTIINLNVIFDEYNYIFAGSAGLIAGRIFNSSIENVYIFGGVINGIESEKLADKLVETKVVLADKLIFDNSVVPDVPNDIENNNGEIKNPSIDNKDDNVSDVETPTVPNEPSKPVEDDKPLETYPPNEGIDSDNSDNKTDNDKNDSSAGNFDNDNNGNSNSDIDDTINNFNSNNNGGNVARDCNIKIILISTLIPLGCVLFAGTVFAFVKFRKRK